MALTAGTRCKLRDAFGTGPGLIPAGTEGVVTGVYGPETFRPGEVEDDVVYVDMDDPGQPAPRSLSVTAQMFEDLFVVVRKGARRGR